MPTPPRDIRPGDTLRAHERNELLASLRQVAGVRGNSGGYVRDTGQGRTLILPGARERIAIKLTGGYAAGYPWKEVVRSGSTWVDTGRVGTAALDPAFELNGDGTLSSGSTVYLAQRSIASGAWIFWHMGASGGGPPPADCQCWTEGTAPATLSWTYVARVYDLVSESFITLGTTSGTLTYTSAVTFGTTPCEVEGIDKDGPAPANPSGWIGEFEFYTYGLPEPGDDFPPVLTPHCSDIAPGGEVLDHEVCRWLALMCQRGLTTEIGGDPVANPLLFLNAIATDPETCGIVSLTGPNFGIAGIADVTCSPFLHQVEFSDGSLLTITT